MASKLNTKEDKSLEKKQKKEELKRKEKLDLCEREITLGKRSWSILKAKWMEVLSKLKLNYLREDFLDLECTVDRLMDAKNFQIMLICDVMEELDKQTHFCAQAQVSNIDKLLSFYLERINKLKNVYQETVQRLKMKAELEFNAIQESQDAQTAQLSSIIYEIEKEQSEFEQELKIESNIKIADEVTKRIETRNLHQGILDKKLETIWSDIIRVLTDYEEKTGARREMYNKLKIKEDADSKIIQDHMTKISKYMESISDLKPNVNFEDVTEDINYKVDCLRRERDEIGQTYREIKSTNTREMELDHSQLLLLTKCSQRVKTQMLEYIKKGENNLKLAAICRKYETEYEKVKEVGTIIQKELLETTLPEQSNLEEVVVPRGLSLQSKVEFEDEVSQVSPDFENLTPFWKKVENVKLSKLTLMNNLKKLEDENLYLKQSLAQYLSFICKH